MTAARAIDTVVVGVGDLKFGRPPVRSVVTHALGSCVGVFAWDPGSRRGACLHFMLPRADGDAEPHRYADTGLPRLIRGLAPDRPAARRLRLVACGGATVNGDTGLFRIGERNIEALRHFLREVGLVLAAQDLGGFAPRTARLDLATGQVTVGTGLRTSVL
ncbi:MAG: chemotaxis protein CheD [Myxococcales bacterium]|nr:chemotaxis protein CheD [Myxococcales bacterium]